MVNANVETIILVRALGAGLFCLAPGSAVIAQVAPVSSEAPVIAYCICLKQGLDVLNARSTAARQTYDQTVSELGQINAQLEAERIHINVNDPKAEARFRRLLARHDRLFERSTGIDFNRAQSGADRYNNRVSEYNSQCANRAWNPNALSQVQATLVCPGF